MVDDKSDDSGPQAGLDRPKRAPPTLDLDAIEISDETQRADAADAAPKPARERSSPLGTIMSSAIVSAIFGAGAAALVVWTMGWPGKTAPPAPAPQVNNAAVDALAARVANVESKAAAPQSNNAAIDALSARVASVESKAATPAVAAPAAPDPALAAQIGTLEKSVATLRDELAATRSQSEKVAVALNDMRSAPRETPPPPDLSAINERLAKIEAAARTLAAEIAQRNAAPVDDPQLRRVVAASLLDVSVRAGEPYAAALAAAKPFAASADALKPLETFAATGVPGTNVLNRELLALLPKLSPPHETSTTGSGIVDRLQAGAARLVRIERTDTVAGNDRNAIVSRVTAAAMRNDIAEARRELKTLEPADRAAAQAWIDKADARDAALAVSRQFAADAMGAFSKPAQ
ncbi:COG4223 family protein [Bradyrhizobium sp.]